MLPSDTEDVFLIKSLLLLLFHEQTKNLKVSSLVSILSLFFYNKLGKTNCFSSSFVIFPAVSTCTCEVGFQLDAFRQVKVYIYIRFI